MKLDLVHMAASMRLPDTEKGSSFSIHIWNRFTCIYLSWKTTLRSLSQTGKWFRCEIWVAKEFSHHNNILKVSQNESSFLEVLNFPSHVFVNNNFRTAFFHREQNIYFGIHFVLYISISSLYFSFSSINASISEFDIEFEHSFLIFGFGLISLSCSPTIE